MTVAAALVTQGQHLSIEMEMSNLPGDSERSRSPQERRSLADQRRKLPLPLCRLESTVRSPYIQHLLWPYRRQIEPPKTPESLSSVIVLMRISKAYRFDLPRIDFDDSYPRCDQFSP